MSLTHKSHISSTSTLLQSRVKAFEIPGYDNLRIYFMFYFTRSCYFIHSVYTISLWFYELDKSFWHLRDYDFTNQRPRESHLVQKQRNFYQQRWMFLKFVYIAIFNVLFFTLFLISSHFKQTLLAKW